MGVRTEGLSKAYGGVTVLRGIDLQVAPGSVFALLGPNGAGKTTLVRILTTLTRPDAGTATVAGHDVLRDPRGVARAITLTGQFAAVDELLTGVENLVMLGRLRRLGRAGARRRAHELLEQFDLTDAGGRLAKTYSGGMRRRLDLAMSLVRRPEVLFLDEPTTGLDPRSRQTTWAAVRALAAEGVTVFLTTQYLEEADQLADRVAFLDRGAIIADGTPRRLKAQLAGERVELHLPAGQLGRAATVLGSGATSDATRGTVTVGTSGSAAEVRELLNLLHTHDIPVDTVAVHRPTLDDVFLTVTGG
ncbi:daunorubicin resistance protein DrrA family ABC transporter ATP-binding protein [Actinoplanes friuliensis]|uniref:Daunorubicin resistance ABC transporter ATPase n=1 Tax=Actinoplanes friuliensis DSM 7358 TaxID=1246995 RepID=U5VRS7_9ACTN|nr:daunorubicin resistance protein DrrA family ABC transporter ATP-binding protein [Actinoplanes friuliensis]AGZ39522.1 daunorubicin resistance ABC transporter ATPase [Actinoplanes friuliensis DSM 7358]